MREFLQEKRRKEASLDDERPVTTAEMKYLLDELLEHFDQRCAECITHIDKRIAK
jgi:hypothetical protein